jgi:hypothetical protein
MKRFIGIVAVVAALAADLPGPRSVYGPGAARASNTIR